MRQLTITHIGFLASGTRQPSTSNVKSRKSHATRSVRQAPVLLTIQVPPRRPSQHAWPNVSLNTVALGPTWPPRQRIRPHSATPCRRLRLLLCPVPQTPQSVLPRCVHHDRLFQLSQLSTVKPQCDSRSSASVILLDRPAAGVFPHHLLHLRQRRGWLPRPQQPVQRLACRRCIRLPHLHQRPVSGQAWGYFFAIWPQASWSTPDRHRRCRAASSVATAARRAVTCPVPAGPAPRRGQQPQRFVHPPILHAPDDRASPPPPPLQGTHRRHLPVHENAAARAVRRPCCPGRFPHDLTGLVDAWSHLRFLGLGPGVSPAGRAQIWSPGTPAPRPARSSQGDMEAASLGQVPRPNRPQFR